MPLRIKGDASSSSSLSNFKMYYLSCSSSLSHDETPTLLVIDVGVIFLGHYEIRGAVGGTRREVTKFTIIL